MQKGLFLSVIVMTFAACSTYTFIDFEVLTPSDITIPNDIKTLAFVYRNTWTKTDTAKFNKQNSDNKKLKIYSNLIDICYEGFADIVVPAEKFDSVFYHKMEQEIIENRENITTLTWDTVNAICSRYGADILVVVERGKFTLEEKYRKNFEQHDIYNCINWDFLIKTYDPMHSTIIDTMIYKDSLSFNTLAVPYNNSDNITYELQRISYIIGQSYAKRTSPYWREVKRKLFISGNNILSAGYYYLQQDKLKVAIAVWQKLIEEGKPRIAAQACINISCAFEMMGDIENAKKYASLSLFHYKKNKHVKDEIKYAKNVTQQLQSRIIEEKNLNEQIN